MIDAQSALLQQSRNGLSLVRSSIESRQQTIESFLTRDRKQLDEAFDSDVIQQTTLSPGWVIEARQVYAAALDGLVRRDASIRNAFETDLDNLRAIDEALAEVDRLNQTQLQWTQALRSIQTKP
jgi:hypothetical protein